MCRLWVNSLIFPVNLRLLPGLIRSNSPQQHDVFLLFRLPCWKTLRKDSLTEYICIWPHTYIWIKVQPEHRVIFDPFTACDDSAAIHYDTAPWLPPKRHIVQAERNVITTHCPTVQPEHKIVQRERRVRTMQSLTNWPQSRAVMSQHHTKQVLSYFWTGYRSIKKQPGFITRPTKTGTLF